MKSTNENSQDIIKDLKEVFIRKEVKKLDKRNRISIGAEIINRIKAALRKVDAFEVFLGEKGDILLRPSVNIPSKELWLYKNPKALNMVREGLKEAEKNNTTQIGDLDQFMDES